MTQRSNAKGHSRRDILKSGTTLAAATVFGGAILPKAYAGGQSTVNLALVGCGGRGTDAAGNALSTVGPIQLVAMADVFQNRLNTSFNGLQNQFGDKFQVTDDRKFIGFDAYRHAMDQLNPGDIVILTTPPAFRWVHFGYAIEKGLNVFMEKPITVDGPSTQKMLELGRRAQEKNLKVGVGLMCRHCEARGELFNRIQDGEIGEIVLLRAYRMVGPTGSAFADPKPEGESELLYQIRNFHGFLWASGGAFSDFLIHNIDESCWMKNAWPVQAQASGGRHYRGNYVDQNFDTYSVEYTFEDGSKMYLEGRNMVGCHDEFASYAHGTKGSAVISTSGHVPARCRQYSGQAFVRDDLVWEYPQPEPNPYQLEWDHLLQSVREDRPHNEVERGAMASVVTCMGRMAAHTGKIITLDQMLNCEHEFAPDLPSLTLDSPAPLVADAEGKYPVPQPGLITDREY